MNTRCLLLAVAFISAASSTGFAQPALAGPDLSPIILGVGPSTTAWRVQLGPADRSRDPFRRVNFGADPLPSTSEPAGIQARTLADAVDGAASSERAQQQFGPDASHQPAGGVRWGPLFAQSVMYSLSQHFVRAAFEDGTWAETKRGIFWDDYFASVKTLCCWDDGDRWTTNDLFHPMMGSLSVFMFANNHEPSLRTPLGNTKAYWGNKGKATIYAFVYSTYFELGPVLSEAAIGNVGIKPGEQTWHDIVITPTFGMLFSVGEDLLRVHVIDPLSRRNHWWGIVLGSFLNPTRSAANLFAGKVPWRAPEALGRRR